MITQCPEDFKDCQYTFEYLVKMQHYGLPTRLLDITSNALVALYFACYSNRSDEFSKDGKVFVYAVRKDAIKNYNSDTVSVLSNLAQLDNNFEMKDFIASLLNGTDKNLKQLNLFIKKIDKELKKSFDEDFVEQCYKEFESEIFSIERSWKDIKNYYNEVEDKSVEKQYKEVIKKIKTFDISQQNKRNDLIDDIISINVLLYKQCEYLESIQDKKERLLYFVRQEKSYFVDKIDNENNVQKIVCVRAKLNNPRIIRQNGLFFLFGMGKTKGDPIFLSRYIKGTSLNSSYDGGITEITNPTIIIAAEKKDDILKELRTLGISKETLMPEIDTVASMLKDRYN